jgi:hypothetical protein
MNIDKVTEGIEAGFQDVQTALYRTTVPDEQMKPLGLRRKDASATQHKVWVLTIGEAGAQPAAFYGHKPSECIKKALAWRGLPTASRGKDGPQKEGA